MGKEGCTWHQGWGLQTEVLVAFSGLASFPDNCGTISLDKKVPSSWYFLYGKLGLEYNVEGSAEALEFSSKFCKTLSSTVILIYNIKWKANLRWSWYLPQYRIRWYITKLRRITVKSPKATITRQERRGLCKTAAETQSKARSWVRHRGSGKNLWYL